ncbi:MAG: phosphatidate cytidylyltransferase [Eubacteriales bacterium]|nr:phosphatidate cytidylyltransferase [Eubacteriales bacterium]
MSTRVISALVYGAIFLFFLALGAWQPGLMTFLWLALAYLASRELQGLSGQADTGPGLFFSLLQNLSLLFPLLCTYSAKAPGLELVSSLTVWLFFLAWQLSVALVQTFFYLHREGEGGLNASLAAFSRNLYLSLGFFSANYLLFCLPYGWHVLLWALVTPWITDSVAWYVGSLWGRHSLTPLSPRKTLEGFLAGLLATGIFYVLVFLRVRGELNLAFYHVLAFFLFGLLAGFMAQLGDLFESSLKRAAGVKDAGNLLPGHGGILDRFDSSLFVLPLFAFLLSLAWLI